MVVSITFGHLIAISYVEYNEIFRVYRGRCELAICISKQLEHRTEACTQ